MLTDEDIEHCAKGMIEQYGADAAYRAHRRAVVPILLRPGSIRGKMTVEKEHACWVRHHDCGADTVGGGRLGVRRDAAIGETPT
jgi:hypothetical protein